MSRFAERQAARPIQESELFELLRHWLVVRRFEKKIIPEPNSGCWLWLGAVGGHGGHGQFFVRKSTKRKGLIQAHRAAWMIYRGPLDAIELVLHRCDTPCCVNPDHLFIGTQKDNMVDASRKGRIVLPNSVGENNPAAKIDAATAIVIRASSDSYSVLAGRFGISKSAVADIKQSRTWRSV